MAHDPDPLRPRGRPRGYDETTALEAAMRVFWARGYEQTPIDTLCRVMGMPRASLYQHFGGKEALFLAAVSHYAETRLPPLSEALGPNGSLEADLRAFFGQVVALATGDPRTRGCLISCVLVDIAATNAAFRAERDRRLDGLETQITQRLQADGWEADGPCPAPTAAALVAAMARGIVLRARSGQGADRLLPVGAAAAEAVVRLRWSGTCA